jgi:hypothetical protein
MPPDSRAFARKAITLDAAEDIVRAIEAYQQSVDLLDQVIGHVRIRRDQRPGGHDKLSLLEAIVRGRLTHVCSLNAHSPFFCHAYFVILTLPFSLS